MHGFWFTAMIAILVAAGVLAQLGWQLPPKDEVKRMFRLDRLLWGRPHTHRPTPVAVAEPR